MRQVVTQREIPVAGELKVAAGAIVTPAARELARERGVSIVEVPLGEEVAAAPPEKILALGSDHGGCQLKEALKPVFLELGWELRDVGVHAQTPVDYPDIAVQVAELVAAGTAARGVLVDGAGIGSAMAANKVPGIRAAACWDRPSARNSREHNDANVLTLGGRLLTATQAEDILRTWLGTPFAAGRHQARVQKIAEIEKRYSR